MSNGTIKWYDPKKGYGFIDSQTEGEVFVHYSSMTAEDSGNLNKGDKVVFEVVKGEKGPKAESVHLAD